MDTDAAKQLVCDEVDRRTQQLLETSHHLHAHPELGYEEVEAHGLLTSLLAAAGLEPERHAYGIDTAFAARHGRVDGPTVAVCLEYDALPGIGHACGHNIIAAAGLGAALAAATVADALGGRLLVLGTPAEEGGGGKVVMADRGAFDGVDAALMVHPADAELTRMTTIAIQQLEVEYLGKAAHAAAAPWEGRNALDGAVLGYVNVAALRQHIQPGERIHGIITDGGERPNIVPRHAAAAWYVRSPTMASLQPLKERVLGCLQGGATAAGVGFEHRWMPNPYADVVDSGAILLAWQANSSRLGRTPREPGPGTQVVGSTDMGNVSYRVPSIHPMIQVAPHGVPIHTPEFAEHAGGPVGDQAVLDGAKALAMTIVDLWADGATLDAAAAEFASSATIASGRALAGG